jgi:gamma-glutamylcyclotransferase (GGCT)/AIG2-like uncharacterized protein YtfP
MNLRPTNSNSNIAIGNPKISAVFVYGTLKRGEQRGSRWPRAALRIQPAWVFGELYDLGPYPALVPNLGLAAADHRILGELWELTPDDMPETLRVLDAIEGYSNAADDLYSRQVVEVHCGIQTGSDEQQVKKAFTYFYARRSELRVEQRIGPDDQGWCSWSAIRPR